MSTLLGIQVLKMFWKSCSAPGMFWALSWSLVQLFSEKKLNWRGMSLATAGVTEVSLMLLDSTHIIFSHVEGCLAVHFYCCQKDWFMKHFEKTLSTSYFGYLPRGIAAAWHCNVAAEQLSLLFIWFVCVFFSNCAQEVQTQSGALTPWWSHPVHSFKNSLWC